MGSVFHSFDTQTAEILTANYDLEIVRLTIANTETSDTQILVNLFKNLPTGASSRIIAYNTSIAGGEMLTLTNIILSAGQYLTFNSDGLCDVDINYKAL